MENNEVEKVVSQDIVLQDEELIPLSNAIMFGLVMAKEENCKEFIQRVLGIKVIRLNVLSTEKVMEAGISIKGTRLDVYAEDDAGKVYDIEMQVSSDTKEFLGRRTRYYQSVMDTMTLRKGSKYWALPDSYIIFVCMFDPFGADQKCYTFNNYCRENKDIELKDGATKVFLNTKGHKGEINPQLANVLNYIVTKEPNDEYTKGLHDDVKYYSSDPKRRQDCMTSKDNEELLQYIIENKDKKIAEQAAELVEKDAELAEKDARLADKDARLADKDAEIEKLKALLAAK